MKKKVKNMPRRQQKAAMSKMRARDFGDNPKIRHSHSEHIKTSKEEPWEQRYSKDKSSSKHIKKKSSVSQHNGYVKDGYTLHTREVTFKSGHTQRIYFFCTTGKKPKSGVPCSKPEGYSVGTNKRTGLPYLKKS